MGFHLIDHGCNFCELTQIDQSVRVEVGHANSPQLSLFVCFLHGSVCAVIISKGLMDQHQVKVVGFQLVQGFVDGCLCLFITGVGHPDLAGEEQFLSGYATGSHTISHTTLVAVGLCGIDMTVAQCHCCLYCLCRLVIGNKPGSQSQLLDLHTII